MFVFKEKLYICNPKLITNSGCSVARLSRRVWDAEVAGSNPATPTKKSKTRLCFSFERLIFYYSGLRVKQVILPPQRILFKGKQNTVNCMIFSVFHFKWYNLKPYINRLLRNNLELKVISNLISNPKLCLIFSFHKTFVL